MIAIPDASSAGVSVMRNGLPATGMGIAAASTVMSNTPTRRFLVDDDS